MSKKSNYTHVVDTLERGSSGIRCKELTKLLKGLGFEVKDGKRGGHKLFFHDEIASFQSSSFNCGHGRDPVVKKVYVNKILNVIKQYENELCEE